MDQLQGTARLHLSRVDRAASSSEVANTPDADVAFVPLSITNLMKLSNVERVCGRKGEDGRIILAVSAAYIDTM